MPWTPQEAWDYYNARPWPCGFNYVPSTAVNSTEMWQAETFDLAMMDRELGWAQDLGLNTCRVFVQSLVWEADPDGFSGRFARFLALADKHGLSVLPILFDDCAFAGKQPYLGRQDDPVPGVHNSGWTPSPGRDRVIDKTFWPGLEAYASELVSRFADDERILAWDVYNEPGNDGIGNASLPLLREAFGWVRAVRPRQALTAGVWNPELSDLNAFSLDASDIVSFHNYESREALEVEIARLKAWGRPLLCTEWMRRTGEQSLFGTHLDVFRRERVGCWFWGLVSGKTQTHFPWGSPEGAPAPEVWFHDLLGSDGTPHQADEMAVIRAHTQAVSR